LHRTPGAEVEYSDVGFIILWAALERAAGEPLPDLLARRIYEPLGMRSTLFQPGAECRVCAPTVRLRNGMPVRGLVHDPLARALGGVAGHAGLFSTSHDLARFAAMLAAGGALDGVRIFEATTIRDFTRAQPEAESRALGWDTPSRDPEVMAESTVQSLSAHAFGHYGFTGTSLWVDPETGLWVVVLTNRVYEPRAPNRIRELRRAIHDHLALAVREPLVVLGSEPE
jgi:CubicO group peptidase (beta-lactamase class C family)